MVKERKVIGHLKSTPTEVIATKKLFAKVLHRVFLSMSFFNTTVRENGFVTLTKDILMSFLLTLARTA